MAKQQNFGAKLRELRKAAGLTLRELAEKVNVNFTYLSKIESSALPPPSEKVIRRIAEVLDYDKDELLALAGIIPSDIAEILKDRKARERLRAEQAKRAKATGIKMPTLPKVSLPLKGLYRVALPVFLVVAVALSVWFASPTQALTVEYTLPTGVIGTTQTITVTINIQEPDDVPIKYINMYIYKNGTYTRLTSPYVASLAYVPLPFGTAVKSYTSAQTGGGAATVTAVSSAAVQTGYATGPTYALWEGTAYQFGNTSAYGYGGSPTYVTYTIRWTSPTTWPAGTYKIDTDIYVSGPNLTKTLTKTSNAFTLSQATGGGGGGGGTVSSSGNTYLYDSVTSSGKFIQNVTAKSADNKVSLDIDLGVIGKDATGKALNKISIQPMSSPPAPPANKSTIGLTYNLGPDGATFDPPITLTFNYDPASLPEGVNEADLTIAYYDSATGEWVVLEGITVDTVNHTISGKVSHFTAFAVLAALEPATFTVSDLVIGPSTIEIGKTSMVVVTVSNTGDISGDYDVVLKVDNTVAETKTVTLAGGTSQKVSFTVSQDTPGTYAINVNGLSGELTFTAPTEPAPEPEPEPEPTPPAPEPELEPTPPAPEPTPQPAPPAPEPAPTPPAEETGINWWLIGGIIAVVIIVAIITWLIAFRRRD